MHRTLRTLTLQVAATCCTLALVQTVAVGAQNKAAQSKNEDDPNLPRVLIIGDSISLGFPRPTRQLLEGKANVHHNPGNAAHTGVGLHSLKKWLGEGHWDVIHFNWGLHDLCYRNPKAKTQGRRDKVDGTLTTSLDQYEKNLRELVTQLKATGATLIWASTTPVPPGEIGRFEGDELKYNAVAVKIMKENGILVNDLHAHALPKLKQIQQPDGDVHYTPKGYEYLAQRVAESILAALAKDSGKNTPMTSEESGPQTDAVKENAK